MKKFLLVLLSVFLFTNNVYAVTAEDEKINLKKYETLNFEEILQVEQIKLQNEEYEENAKQVTIYLFRGDGCGYCRNFLTFLSSISTEYGAYFKVVGFEVWSNKENSKLLDKISTFMGSSAGGVPYIIIGEDVFPGYAETYDESIKTSIMNLYNSSDRYDVFKEYNKAVDRAKKAANGNAPTIIFWNFVFITLASIAVIHFNKKNTKALIEELTGKREIPKEVKETVQRLQEKGIDVKVSTVTKPEKKEVKKAKNVKKKKK